MTSQSIPQPTDSNEPANGDITRQSEADIQSPPTDMPDAIPPSDLITLKQAADTYNCKLSTLRRWGNTDKLAKTKQNPDVERSPWMVRPADVEKLLQESPNVESSFHPREPQSPPSEKTLQPTSPKESKGNQVPPANKRAKRARSRKAKPHPSGSDATPTSERSPNRNPSNPRDHRKHPHADQKKQRDGRLQRAKKLADALPLGDKVKLRNWLSTQIDYVL